MSQTLASVLVVSLDVAAIAATGFLATRFARSWILGALAGVAVELVRIFTAMAIVGQSFSGDTLAWLVNFRLFNVPILVGVGFMAGTAAAQQARLERVVCPSCNAPIDLNRTLLQSKAVVSNLVTEACPACNVQLAYDVGSDKTSVSLAKPAPAQAASAQPKLILDASRPTFLSSEKWGLELTQDEMVVTGPSGERRMYSRPVANAVAIPRVTLGLASSNLMIQEKPGISRVWVHLKLASEDLKKLQLWLGD